MGKPVDIQKEIILKLFPENGLPAGVKSDILEHVDFRRELVKESDRGCALLGASHLDFLLAEMIKSKIFGSNNFKKSLFDFNGPLGTFSSRILLSYSIGLISKSRMNDLQTIRKIRNEFGHSPSVISFEDLKIKSLCANLKMITTKKRGPRSRFITSVLFVSGGLVGVKFLDKKFEELDKVKIKDVQDAEVATREWVTSMIDEYLEPERLKSK